MASHSAYNRTHLSGNATTDTANNDRVTRPDVDAVANHDSSSIDTNIVSHPAWRDAGRRRNRFLDRTLQEPAYGSDSLVSRHGDAPGTVLQPSAGTSNQGVIAPSGGGGTVIKLGAKLDESNLYDN